MIVDNLVEQRIALEGATGVGFPCSSLAFPQLTVWESKHDLLDETALSVRVLNYTRDVEAFLLWVYTGCLVSLAVTGVV